MSRLVAAELLKLRTIRTAAVLVLVAAALVALFAVLTLALSDLDGGEDVRSLLSVASFGGLFALLLGVVGTTGEWRHNTITAAVLVSPDRPRLIAAKAIALALAGGVVGLACVALAAAIAFPWLAATDVEVGLSGGEVAGIVVGNVVYSALAAALGVGLGALVANQLVAVVVALAVLLVVQPTVTALAPGYAPYSLGGLGTAITGGSEGDLGSDVDLYSGWASGLLFLLYAAVLVALGAIRTERRDIA